MKFASKLDAQIFLSEIKVFDKIGDVDKDYTPTLDEMKSFIKARTPLVKKLKNYRKSANAKANWRENRTKMMKGIKSFHKSTDGKRFHKRLGKFMATRLIRTKSNESNSEVFSGLLLKQGFLKGLNTAKQHMLVSLEYFHQLQEQLELEEMIVDYALPYFHRIEHKIITGEDLSESETIFLLDITEESCIIQKLAEINKQEFAEMQKVWNSITTDIENRKIAKSEVNYYPILIESVKQKLGRK